MKLLDTDILIDLLRGAHQATGFFQEETEPLAVSVVTVAELYAGVRDKEEEAAIESLLAALQIFELDRGIAEQGGRFRQRYFRSHGIELADALIAATSVVHRIELVTLNRRHYPMLKDLLVPYRK